MMNSYQSQTGLSPSNSKKEMKPAAKITESPFYSAHTTTTKFFKTIDESPFLGARGNTPKSSQKPVFINKYRAGSLYET